MNNKKEQYITPNTETIIIHLEDSVFQVGTQGSGGLDYVKEEGLNASDEDMSIWNEEEVEVE